MNQIYGRNTNIKTTNGKSIYEFDRVYAIRENAVVPGTVVNVGDMWHPIFKVLIDTTYWTSASVPEYTDCFAITDLIATADKNYKCFIDEEDFAKYCIAKSREYFKYYAA